MFRARLSITCASMAGSCGVLPGTSHTPCCKTRMACRVPATAAAECAARVAMPLLADVAASIAQCGGVQALVGQLTAADPARRAAGCFALYFLGWQGSAIR